MTGVQTCALPIFIQTDKVETCNVSSVQGEGKGKKRARGSNDDKKKKGKNRDKKKWKNGNKPKDTDDAWRPLRKAIILSCFSLGNARHSSGL